MPGGNALDAYMGLTFLRTLCTMLARTLRAPACRQASILSLELFIERSSKPRLQKGGMTKGKQEHSKALAIFISASSYWLVANY